jgi:hypothetical protein
MFTKNAVNKAVCRAYAGSLAAEVRETVRRAITLTAAPCLFALAVFVQSGPSFAGAIDATASIRNDISNVNVSQLNVGGQTSGLFGLFGGSWSGGTSGTSVNTGLWARTGTIKGTYSLDTKLRNSNFQGGTANFGVQAD